MTVSETAVVTQSKTQKAIGNLPPEIQAAVELRRAQNIVAAQLSESSWGKGMDRETRRAVAEWGRRHGIDVTTEIHVLGGNVYLNSAFFLHRLAKMVERGQVEYAVADHVECDPRLVEFPEEAKRRTLERVRYQLPDNAKSAVVARIKLNNTAVEFSAAKWCGGRGNNKHGNPKDPIGDEFPVETSESRAFRRCLKLLVSHIPDEVRRIQEAEEDAQVSLGMQIESDHDRQLTESVMRQRQLHPGNVVDAMASYGQEAAVPVAVKEAEPTAEPEYQDDSALAND
jgi:hypothetical protein